MPLPKTVNPSRAATRDRTSPTPAPTWFPGLVLVLATALFFTGCKPTTPPTLRIAINAWPPGELLFLAREKGFFAEAGVQVDIIEFASLTDSRRAYERGQVDGLAATLVEVLAARDASGRDLRVCRIINFSDGADVLVARNESVADLSALRGKRVGVEPASVGLHLLTRALDRAGLGLDDLQPVAKFQTTLPGALLSGEVDAVVSHPPDSTNLLSNPAFHVLFSSRELPGEIVDVYAFDAEVIRRAPQALAAFKQAMDRAFHELEQDPEGSCLIMARRHRTDPASFAQSLRDGIALVKPEQQHAYLGRSGLLAPVLVSLARTLRYHQIIRPDQDPVACLELP